MTLNDAKPIFQGHDIMQCQITQKWHKIELCLQWPMNRQLYVSNGNIFNDLERPIN